METHLLPSNRDGSYDKLKLIEHRDNRKSIGISKTILGKRSKSTKLNLNKYCGNEIKDRIKRSLQLRKSTTSLGDSYHTNGDLSTVVGYPAHVNGKTFDDIVNEKENYLPIHTSPQLKPSQSPPLAGAYTNGEYQKPGSSFSHPRSNCKVATKSRWSNKMYEYHYETASNSTNGSGSHAQSNKYMSGGKAHGNSNDPSTTFYCTDLVSKQQLCDIALSMASLCNIGNSCYMNSVLYTLRFTPLFLHNLHHLVHDFAQIVSRRETHMKLKSSSLGRNVSGLQGHNARSYSSKDLASLGATTSSASTSSTSSSTSSSLASSSVTSAAAAAAAATAFDIVKTTQQNAMEKLHELFKNLTSNEVNETTEPYQSDLFLKAIQDVNPIFEGNQQQDAHEFLMCILDSIRESCQALTKLITDHPEIAFNSFVEQFERAMTVKQVVNTQPATEKKTIWFKRRKDDKNKTITIESPSKDSGSFDSTASANDASDRFATPQSSAPEPFMSKEMVRDKIKALGLDFFSKDFEGVTASSIQCLACETTTEQKETMIDLAVPITENMETNELSDSFIQNLCITRERFHGDNKFRCENCMGLTEAIRKISYPKLPRLLIIQLKRFSGGMEKINSYIPTPFTLQCFCSTCINDHGGHSTKDHEYQLYSVITHVGSTLQAGHYIAYTSSLNQHNVFLDCVKDINRKEFAFLSSTTMSATQPPVVTSLSSSTLSSTTSVMKKIGLGRKKSTTNADTHKNVKGINGLKTSAMNGVDGATIGGTGDGNGGSATSGATKPTPCPSSTCCAIKMKSHLPNTPSSYASSNGNNDTATTSNGTDSMASEHNGRKGNAHNAYADQYYGSQNSSSNSHASAKMHYEPIWYMCDDDKIKAIPQHEFREMLLPKKNMITPYLLFYARNDVFESH